MIREHNITKYSRVISSQKWLTGNLRTARCGAGARREGGNRSTEGEWLPFQVCLQTLLPRQTKARQKGAET